VNLEHVIRTPIGGERKATPVLLLHGAWHAAWCYDLWLEEFAANGYETHAMSLPAHGNSSQDKPIALYRVAEYVKAVEQVVNEIKPTPFVIAHSMGGFVLQRYLKSHQLPGAVLLCALPSFGALPFYLRYLVRHPLRYIVSIVTARLDRMVKTPELAREYFLTEGAMITGVELSARLQNESLAVALEAGILPRTSPRKVKTPLLVVAAGRDAIFPVSEVQHTAKAYGAEFMLFEDQGHSLMVERRWQEVAGKIREWLERLDKNSQ
jgi:pimeloyl-ACP methyl ester carboxylesterase